MTRGRRGSSVVEALAALGLAALAVAGLAGAAGVAGRNLRLARDTTTALAHGCERLETMRAGRRQDGSDTPGTVFSRSWSQSGGRGRPARLSARVTWGAHAADLATEAMP